MISKLNGQDLTHHHVLVRRAGGDVLCLKSCGVELGVWNKIERMVRNELMLKRRMSVSRCDRWANSTYFTV